MTDPAPLREATIDYGYGVARLWGSFTKKEVEQQFYHHAGQCFGIRKSISRCVIREFKKSKLPKVFGCDPAAMAVVLMHNGDVIVWGHDGEKIKTEFD